MIEYFYSKIGNADIEINSLILPFINKQLVHKD